MNFVEIEDCVGAGVNIRLIHAEVVEELVTLPDPCHIEVRSCVEATAMIIDGRGINTFRLLSLSEVERTRFPGISRVEPVAI